MMSLIVIAIMALSIALSFYAGFKVAQKRERTRQLHQRRVLGARRVLAQPGTKPARSQQPAIRRGPIERGSVHS